MRTPPRSWPPCSRLRRRASERVTARKVLPVLLGLALQACQGSPYDDPAKAHHTPEGFRNIYPHPPRGSFFAWRWQRWRDGLPARPKEGYRFEVMTPDAAWLRANRSETAITWIGHATLLLQVGGINVLTDPQFSRRASPFSWIGPQRVVPPALSLGQLPHIDVVLISHNHYDHLDLASVRGLAAQPGGPPRFFVPLGLKRWFAREGIETVTEQDWWDHADLLGLRIHQVPAQHFSSRTPWDRNATLWGGFVVEHPSLRFYFAGDTGYSPHFAEIRARLGPPDIAALPIGAYEPRWFMRAMHINPAEAVQAMQDLRARLGLAMHWGTFELTDEAIDEPPRALARALGEAGIMPERFLVLKHGEMRRMAPLLAEPQPPPARAQAR